MKVALSEILSYGPCQDRLNYGLQHADPLPADDEPFPASRVLETNGLSDALWLLGEMSELLLIARFASGCAERAVERYWEPEYPDDRRPQEAIEAARRCVENPTAENRRKANDAARAAYYAARVAYYAAKATYDAAYYAARAAYYAARAAAKAARADAVEEDAADAEESKWQIDHLRKALEDA